MLYVSIHPNATPAPVSGRQLAHCVHKLSPRQRALLAFDLERGGIAHLTRRQATQLAHANTTYTYGKDVTQGDVVYVALEGTGGIGKRVDAHRKTKLNGTEDIRLLFLGFAVFAVCEGAAHGTL